MFSHNKFLSFLIACTVANPCFAAVTLGNFNSSGINTNIGGQQFDFPGGLLLGWDNDTNTICEQGHYISRCGNADFDLNKVLSYVIGYYKIQNTCWNQKDNYTNMHYLFHLNNNNKDDYLPVPNPFLSHFTACGDISEQTSDVYTLNQFRQMVYNACINSSVVCSPCPNNGTTDSASVTFDTTCEIKNENGDTPETEPCTRWQSFNTIADCYTKSGSDGKGTFEVNGPDDEDDETEANRCYYSYSE